MDKESIEQIISSFYKEHRGLKKCNHYISAIENPKDFNEELSDGVKGIYRARSNNTFIVASAHHSKEDVLNTLKHEIYGHLGLNTLTQEEKIDILLSIVHLQDDELKDEWEHVRFNYPNAKEFRQAEEVFCTIASSINTNLELVKSATSTPELKSEIINIVKFIKIGLQSGNIEINIIPENNNLQFNKEVNKAEYIAKKTTGKKINTLSSEDAMVLINKYGVMQAIDKYASLTEVDIDQVRYIISSNNRVTTISKRNTWNKDLFENKNNFTSGVRFVKLDTLENQLFLELERTESLSDDTKERIHAYGSLMEDKALMDAVRSTDSEDLAALGEYFQELSQNDYVDYDTFGNNQIQEMR